MKVELKAPELRKLIGKTVFLERTYTPIFSDQYVEVVILEVYKRNVLFDKFDWMDFDRVKNIFTERPCT